MTRIASVNINGIRAAIGKNRGQSSGLAEWLLERDCDIVTLQEVRAPDTLVHEMLEPFGYHVVHAESATKGRAGVAVLSRFPITAHRVLEGEFADTGRWIEADVDLGESTLTVVSAYVHTGEAGTPRQDEKFRFLDTLSTSLARLQAGATHALVTGDLNIAHTERDIRNWKGNVKKAGFLPEERAYFRAWADHGWVDVPRLLAGDVDGPYTWWSMRGQAFDTDTGWRIDHQLATPELAGAAKEAWVDRAVSWAERWSDHAPLVVDYSV